MAVILAVSPSLHNPYGVIVFVAQLSHTCVVGFRVCGVGLPTPPPGAERGGRGRVLRAETKCNVSATQSREEREP